MTKINQKQLKNMVTWLKNYANAKISSNGSVTLDPNSATKEYADDKMMFDGYEVIYRIPADDITNAAQKYDDKTYIFETSSAIEINDTDKYIIEYERETYGAKVIYNDESGFDYEDGVLLTTDDDVRIVIMNKWGLYTTDENKCRVQIKSVNTWNITDLVVKRKAKRPLNVLTMTKAEYNALTTKDNSTIYLIIE